MNSAESGPDSPLSHRPAPLGSGTAGQRLHGAGAASLKSLARKVLERAKTHGNLVPQLVPATRLDGTKWDATDWHTYFDERASIAEYQHGCNRTVAEVRGYSACVVEWCRQRPIPENDPSECRYCHELRQGASIVPVLNGAGRHFWIHNDCLPAHLETRRRHAILALQAIGLEPPAAYRI